MLILKYNAYFGSTSPLYPKKGQPPTTEVLAGDDHLKREWGNVSVRRKEFCEYQAYVSGIIAESMNDCG